MKHISCVVGSLGTLLLSLLGTLAAAQPPGPSLLGGLVRCTPSVTVPAGAAVYCYATAETPDEGILLTAWIMANKNKNVTQWGYGFRAAPGVVSLGYYAEELGASTSARSRYCEVVVDPASAAVTIDFAVHYAGEIVQEFTTLGPCPENKGQGQ